MSFNRLSEKAYGLMRLIVGLLFACHGAQKLLPVFGGPMASGRGAMVLAAGIIELGGGLLIALGLATRAAAFIASGEMAVAYFKAHAPQGFWPLENKGEAAALFCFVFLFVAAAGGGLYSLDHLLWKNRRAADPGPAPRVPR